MRTGGVSVVVGAFNRVATLDLLVRALRRQRLVGRLDVVIADGGSSPPVSVALPGLDADTVLYWREDGLYHRVRSFNAGVAAAVHELVILLDDDVVPASDYWAAAALDAFAADPGLDIVRLPVEILDMAPELSDARRRRRELAALQWAREHAFPTWNLAVRRSAWRALGGFNATYDGAYGHEDRDFHARARALGLRYGVAGKGGCAVHIGTFFKKRKLGKPVHGAAMRRGF
jgi:GT2 family glycosyltransferase